VPEHGVYLVALHLLDLLGAQPEDVDVLLAGLFGASSSVIPAELRARIVTRAGGNPLYVEEVVRGLIADGVLARDGDRWTCRADGTSVEVPVTLKYRTGWDAENRNAVRVARIAEESGIRLLALHGRTRACGFSGNAEYDTIAAVKRAATIPVIANGDIRTPEKVKQVLDYTKADAVMIGRAAQGRPWMFREVSHFLETGAHLPPPQVAEIHRVLVAHLHELYGFYGEYTGVRVARKHISWYTKGLAGSAGFRHRMNQLGTCEEQLAAVNEFFEQLACEHLRLRYEEELAA